MVRPIMGVLVLLTVSSLAVHAQAPQTSKPQTPPASKPQAPPVSKQQDQTLNLHAYAELLRSDVRTQKVAIITEVMGFTEAEDKAFWPIYRQYDAEMSKLGDERVSLIE